MVKSKLVQGGDGTAIPAGMVGEVLSAATIVPSYGVFYQDYTTTNFTTSGTAVVLTKTLNKGRYLCFVTCTVYSATTQDLYFLAELGGTQVGPTYRGGNVAASYLNLNGVYALDITSDGTVFNIFGSGSGNTSLAQNSLTILRIA